MCNYKPIVEPEVGRGGGGFLVTEESPMVMTIDFNLNL